MGKEKTKIKNCLKSFENCEKGSALVFSLIILSMMLMIATGLSSIAIVQKKEASATQFSVQAYQVADSGVQLALKKINEAIFNNSTIESEFPSCVGVGSIYNLTDFGAGNSYDLSFYRADGTLVNCNEDASLVTNIKSVGRHHNTVRAVNVAVATVPNPVAWWKIDEGSGTFVEDSSESNNDGQWSGSGSHWIEGIFNQAGDFNGTNDFIFNAEVSNMPTTMLTLSAWVRIRNLTSDKYIVAVGRDTGGPAGGMALLSQSGNRFNFEFGSAVGRVQSDTIVQANTWYHVEATTDGFNTNLYVNGVLENTAAQGTGSVADNPGMAVGTHLSGAVPPVASGFYFNGQIDDVRVYNYARTQEQVLQDMSGN
ncbi:MAG: hypothetical protein HGA61_02775 [Candidatus Moranbacteria bacterium]|nr:hypothetical protein [Candidatus Moranbacteria bacterium]